MKLKRSLLVGVSSALFCATGAFAADIPLRGTIVAPPPIAAAAALGREGFYAGLHAGYGRSLEDKVGIYHIGPGGGNVRNVGGNLTPGGALGGLHIGYNWQSGSVVYGVEADGSFLTGKSSFTGTYPAPIGGVVTTSASKAAFGSLRTRLGYSFGSMLIYGTSGISVTHVRYQLTPVGGTPMSASNARISPVFGGGAEYAFNSNWSARIEGLYTPIGLRKLPVTAGAAGQVTTFETQGHWLARVGVSYRFGGSPAQAISARF